MGILDIKIQIATAPSWKARNEKLERLKSTAGPSTGTQPGTDHISSSSTAICVPQPNGASSSASSSTATSFYNFLSPSSTQLANGVGVSALSSTATPSYNFLSLTPTPLANGEANGFPENKEPTKRTLPPKLYKAAMQSDVDQFIRVLEETCAEMNQTFSEILELVSPMGNTLLHVAARETNLEIVRLLAYHSPTLILKQNMAGDTALHVGVRAGDCDIASTLLRFSPYWVEDGAGDTHIAELSALPHNKRLLRFRNNKGNIALHEWAMKDHGWYFSSLDGLDPETVYFLNNDGKSPLYYAVEEASKAKDKWHFIFVIGDNTEELIKGKSPLIPAIRAKNKVVVDKIISEVPAFINLVDEEGKTPLHVAASVGSVDIVQYLIAKDVECLLKWDNNGFFPMHIAASHGHVQIVEELLRHCPDPREMLTRNGQNILHIAAARGKNKVVGFILKTPSFGSLINEVDENGNTPLHLATVNWHPKIVNTLTWDKRVNPGIINNQGFTALDAAEYYMDSPCSFDKRITWTILHATKAPRAPKKDKLELYPCDLTQSQTSNTSHTDNYKDRVNTLLLVATLVATITFAAGFTMPGGYNNSAPNEGMATMLQKRAFYVFVFSDTIALYSSILVAVSLIWAQLGDVKLVHTALRLAIPLLGVSLAMMSLAFMAGVYLVVSTLNWLAYSVLTMGSTFLCAHLVIFFPLCFPVTSGNTILRYISYYPLQLLIVLTSDGKDSV